MKNIAIIAFLILTSFSANAENGAELWAFGGKAVSNSIKDTKSSAWGVYQETQTNWGRWDLGYLNEGHQGGVCNLKSCYNDKRDGIFALYEMQYKLNDSFRSSFAIGPYFSSTTITDPNRVNYRDAYRTDLLGKTSLKYSINSKIDTELSWWHVIYSTNDLLINGRASRGDADIFSIGVAYKF